MSTLLADTPITKIPLRRMFRPHRLIIMKILEHEGEKGISFQQLKTLLRLTDGNLASHLKSLEDENYITFYKEFQGHRTTTIYKLTTQGRKTLNEFTKELMDILKS